MSALTIKEFGDPLLRAKAQPVDFSEFNSNELSELIKDMTDTMIQQHGIGIAAPQVGVLKRIAIVGQIQTQPAKSSKKNNQKQKILFFTIINPKIVSISEKVIDDWEGCLSLPKVRGKVSRPDQVSISFLNFEGKEEFLTVEGYNARVIQHEIDHLDGILFVDRMLDMSTLSTEREANKMMEGELGSSR